MSQATKHTAIISDPVSMWSKLAWDADCFRDIQTSYPDEKEPLAYAAINVCIAAASLQDWVEEFLKRMASDSCEPWDKNAFFNDVISAIPEQSACVAIANTSKHSNFRERRWLNGEVLLAYEEGDEDIPSGYVLYHVIAQSHSEGFALNRFDDLCRNWWAFLTARGLTQGHSGMPEWRSNKLNRIFRSHL
jgi:hypothetical protein